MKIIIAAFIFIAGIFIAALIFTWWETKLRKPIDPKKKYAKVKTDKGIKTAEVITLNYRTKRAWVKIGDEFLFVEMQNCELL